MLSLFIASIALQQNFADSRLLVPFPAPRNLRSATELDELEGLDPLSTEPESKSVASYHLNALSAFQVKLLDFEVDLRPELIKQLEKGRVLFEEIGQDFKGSESLKRTKYAFNLEGRLLFFSFNLFGESIEVGTIEVSRSYVIKNPIATIRMGRGLRLSYVLRSKNILGFSSFSVRDFRDTPTKELLVAAYGYPGFVKTKIPVFKFKNVNLARQELESALIEQYRCIESNSIDRSFEPIEISYSQDIAKNLEDSFRKGSGSKD